VWEDVRISLGPDAEANGRLSFVSPTRIEGKVKGEVRSSDLIVVGPQAVVHATVRADKLVVMGEVRGEVLGASLIEICAGGRLFGDVETQSFVIREGATFEGRSRMGGQASAAAGVVTAASATRDAPREAEARREEQRRQ
jgi:cytoskeletal protein CcmA (bactofilin family)